MEERQGEARRGAPEVPEPEGDNHRLDVYMAGGEVVDVRLNGRSVWPTWFKLEWKGNGDLSAKVQGVRLSTRTGDQVVIHHRS